MNSVRDQNPKGKTTQSTNSLLSQHTAQMGPLIYLLIAGFVLYVIRSSVVSKWQLKIIVTQDRVDFVSGVPQSRQGLLESFFLNDLKPNQKITVLGRREKNGRLIISVKGTKDQGVIQRVRNFMLSSL